MICLLRKLLLSDESRICYSNVKVIAEDFFAHVIVREEHVYLAKIIGEGIQKDFGK